MFQALELQQFKVSEKMTIKNNWFWLELCPQQWSENSHNIIFIFLIFSNNFFSRGSVPVSIDHNTSQKMELNFWHFLTTIENAFLYYFRFLGGKNWASKDLFNKTLSVIGKIGFLNRSKFILEILTMETGTDNNSIKSKVIISYF